MAGCTGITGLHCVNAQLKAFEAAQTEKEVRRLVLAQSRRRR